MKTILITLVSLLTLLSGKNVAQDLKITLKDVELEKKTSIWYYAYTVDKKDNYVLFKSKQIRRPRERKLFIETRDSEGNYIGEVDITEKFNDLGYYRHGDIKLQDKVIFFSSTFDRENLEEKFYYQSVDLISQECTERKMFYKIKYDIKRRRPEIEFKASKNQNVFFIMITPHSVDKSKQEHNFWVLDKDLNPIWEKENFTFNMPQEKKSELDFVVGESGALFALRHVWGEDKTFKSQLFKFYHDNVVSKDFKLKGRDTNLAGLFLDSYDNLFIAYYYTDDVIRGTKGLSLSKVDQNDLRFTMNFETKFSDEMILFGESPKVRSKLEKKAERKDQEIGSRSIRVESLLNDEEGNIYIIGAVIWFEEVGYVDGNGRHYSQTIDHHDDLYVSKFTKECKHVYDAKIPKKHFNLTPYSCLIKNGRISFVFFDSKENMRSENIRLNGVKDGAGDNKVLGLCTVAQNGELVRSPLFDYKKNMYKEFWMGEGMVGLTEMLFYCRVNNKEHRFVIIE